MEKAFTPIDIIGNPFKEFVTLRTSDHYEYSLVVAMCQHRWHFRACCDRLRKEGEIVVEVPGKGRARWLRRNTNQLLAKGFKGDALTEQPGYIPATAMTTSHPCINGGADYHTGN